MCSPAQWCSSRRSLCSAICLRQIHSRRLRAVNALRAILLRKIVVLYSHFLTKMSRPPGGGCAAILPLAFQADVVLAFSVENVSPCGWRLRRHTSPRLRSVFTRPCETWGFVSSLGLAEFFWTDFLNAEAFRLSKRNGGMCLARRILQNQIELSGFPK